MCRFVDAGSGVARRPLVWLSLLAWAGCTLLAHWFLPTLPAHRFDVEAAARAGEMQDADFNDRHAFPSTWWNVLGISPDGDTVVYRYRSNGILRYCNTKNGECRNTSSETMVKPSELFAPEQAWRVKILADSGDGKRLVQFVHRETGKSSPRIPANFVGSANGRLVIYEDGESNFLHDLETGHTRLLAPTAEKDGHSPFAVHCFSDDGRLAVGANGGNVLIIDVETGTIAKVLPSRNDEHRIFPSNVSLTPDGHGVAWESRRGVVISDLADTKRLARKGILEP